LILDAAQPTLQGGCLQRRLRPASAIQTGKTRRESVLCVTAGCRPWQRASGCRCR
jgi:hypothetical protein